MGHPTRVARLAFVMEQHLGHRTYADNLRIALDAEPDLETHWIPVRYETTSKWWERIPVEGLRAAGRGRSEVRRGLAGVEVDVCVFNTQVPAALGGRRARRTPYVLCMDDTPRLMDSVGARQLLASSRCRSNRLGEVPVQPAHPAERGWPRTVEQLGASVADRRLRRRPELGSR